MNSSLFSFEIPNNNYCVHIYLLPHLHVHLYNIYNNIYSYVTYNEQSGQYQNYLDNEYILHFCALLAVNVYRGLRVPFRVMCTLIKCFMVKVNYQ